MTIRASASNVIDDFVTYDPSRLLDELIEKLCLQSDSELARTIDVAPTVISKIRHRLIPVGPIMLIRMHEVSELTIGELRLLMGDRRQKMRHNGQALKPQNVE
ncbi:hypothetical protein [Collimonas humicola]|uniref:hypothetical protein n=1 Tax=Collimonas humicola TaxID=2825886 RepID=UPI001B8C4605|nr:hypothetical protein [Collimonas humicola]